MTLLLFGGHEPPDRNEDLSPAGSRFVVRVEQGPLPSGHLYVKGRVTDSVGGKTSTKDLACFELLFVPSHTSVCASKTTLLTAVPPRPVVF